MPGPVRLDCLADPPTKHAPLSRGTTSDSSLARKVLGGTGQTVPDSSMALERPSRSSAINGIVSRFRDKNARGIGLVAAVAAPPLIDERLADSRPWPVTARRTDSLRGDLAPADSTGTVDIGPSCHYSKPGTDPGIDLGHTLHCWCRLAVAMTGDNDASLSGRLARFYLQVGSPLTL